MNSDRRADALARRLSFRGPLPVAFQELPEGIGPANNYDDM